MYSEHSIVGPHGEVTINKRSGGDVEGSDFGLFTKLYHIEALDMVYCCCDVVTDCLRAEIKMVRFVGEISHRTGRVFVQSVNDSATRRMVRFSSM